MARLKTVYCSVGRGEEEHLQFRYTVNVDQSGLFTTTIPQEIVAKFDAAGITLPANQLGNRGYFRAATFSDLQAAVRGKAGELVSKKLISEKTVLRYKIETACSYAMDDAGEIYPNAAHDYFPGEDYTAERWRHGTKDTSAGHKEPYGLNVVIQVMTRKDYEFKSGRKVVRYESFDSKGATGNLKWLRDLCGMGYDRFAHRLDDMDEIDYTEAVALFFVNLIKGICLLNEQIKDKLDPESIKMLAHEGKLLLGAGSE